MVKFDKSLNFVGEGEFFFVFDSTSSEGSEDKLSLSDDRQVSTPEQNTGVVKSPSWGSSKSGSPGNKSPVSLFRERYLDVVLVMHDGMSQISEIIKPYLYVNSLKYKANVYARKNIGMISICLKMPLFTHTCSSSQNISFFIQMM